MDKEAGMGDQSSRRRCTIGHIHVLSVTPNDVTCNLVYPA